MYRVYLATLALCWLALPLWGADKAPAKRPNIILIMADDMGYSDIGCFGSEINTPNLDKLASQGIRFTQFYNAARCCPTRAALLTGLYPHQAGVGHMTENRGHPSYQGYLNDHCVTIGEVLRTAGYRTYISGKWHVGDDRPHWPIDRGFDRSYSLVYGGSNYFRLEWPGRRRDFPIKPKLVRDDKVIQPEENWYATDAITKSAVDFLKEHDPKKPFFLYVPYTAPHWPLHAWPKDVAKYRGKYLTGWDALRKQRHKRLIDMGLVDPRWSLSPRDQEVPPWEEAKDKETWDLKMAVYAAQIDSMDQGIGKILAQVKALDAEENTLVLFLSDNGGCAEIIDWGQPGAPAGDKDSFMSYGIGWANASNTPFRRYKHWVHEGGIATPLIAYWPATIKKPAVTSQPGHIIDFMATFVEAAGTQYPKSHMGRDIIPLEGKSLLPIFQGKKRAGHEELFWEHEGNRAVLQGKWKLVALHRGEWELYDMETDRTELNNIAAKHPAKVKELAEKYERWAKRCGVLPWDDIRGKRVKPKQP